MNKLFGFAALFSLWLVGEGVAMALSLPIPGAVIGMVLLLLVLVCLGEIPDVIAQAADGLLAYLALLFVPAGVGIMVYGELLLTSWLPLLLALSGLVLLSLLGTAGVMTLTGRLLTLLRRPPSTASSGPAVEVNDDAA